MIELKKVCKIFYVNAKDNVHIPSEIKKDSIVRAVNDFNLVIEDGEFIVLVGPSGCGKTTVLRMIAGLESISGGEILIDGKIVNNIMPKDRNIAMVFQNYALYPHVNVFKNIAYGLIFRKYPRKEIKKRVIETAKILNIDHLLLRKPGQLSGGERQRVALGRAMVQSKPKAYLFDEPLSNLDANLRVSTRVEISLLHKRLGTTFIYVTHDQVEAMSMSDRIVVMKDGYIQQIGTPYDLYNHPKNMFVASFIGEPQMNFVPMTLKKEENEYNLIKNEIIIKIPEPKAKDRNLEQYENEEVIVGIRPENILMGNNITSNLSSGINKADVEWIDELGGEKLLYIKIDDIKLTVKAPDDAMIEEWAYNAFVIDSDKIHLFDKATELSI
jgi:multiple sugar transport system ATP-binding protein